MEAVKYMKCVMAVHQWIFSTVLLYFCLLQLIHHMHKSNFLQIASIVVILYVLMLQIHRTLLSPIWNILFKYVGILDRALTNCAHNGHLDNVNILISGWPQTWKTQGISKIVKISGKTQGNLNFCRKNLEHSGKMKKM